jgi:YfiR/HmsC-like
MLVSRPLRTQEPPAIRVRSEANFLANFPHFVEWPASAFPDHDAPFDICFFGGADFGTSLTNLTKGVLAQGRHIEVRLANTMSQFKSCHILFVNRTEAKNYQEILHPLQDLPILTVGETENFLDAGGVMTFVFGETLQFDINITAENRAHLKVRSNLAALARRLVNMPAAKD